MKTLKVRHYFAEWKHPETKQWVRITPSIPALKKAELECSLSDDCRKFSILDSDFRRLHHLNPQWRVILDGWHEVSVEEKEGRDYLIYLADGSVVGYSDVDELFYEWVVGGIFGIDWF